jgi:hypothetical protein
MKLSDQCLRHSYCPIVEINLMTFDVLPYPPSHLRLRHSGCSFKIIFTVADNNTQTCSRMLQKCYFLAFSGKKQTSFATVLSIY